MLFFLAFLSLSLLAAASERKKGLGARHAIILDFDPFTETLDALSTLQDKFFEIWLGLWPTTIDWTGAVMGTYVSACISSIIRAQPGIYAAEENLRLQNEIDKYFSQTVSYYFGEDAFQIRNEAYDDILWVVLGWLESIKSMNLRSKYDAQRKSSTSWYGNQFKPAFAHRAHIFYTIARNGWDNRLCGGGLTWNPNLEPYKNTITNTLFITASVQMYLYHPGDDNSSPFIYRRDNATTEMLPPVEPHDPEYLDAAIAGYDWLKSVNLTNELGLFVDGYHIRDWWRGHTTCNVRNEMVYTYNQGVLLTGLRGLWESTGKVSYLEDGHQLVRNVISATGWSLEDGNVIDLGNLTLQWHGLGSRGILTELCDPSGTCSQDGQTFKGIFFHHLTSFCHSLPTDPADAAVPGKTWLADRGTAGMHRRSCASYVKWVARNAIAALDTRDDDGVFGMWWGVASGWSRAQLERMLADQHRLVPENAVDLRQSRPESRHHGISMNIVGSPQEILASTRRITTRDVNDRGRGRTVETQSGGLMVVRALFELLREYSDNL